MDRVAESDDNTRAPAGDTPVHGDRTPRTSNDALMNADARSGVCGLHASARGLHSVSAIVYARECRWRARESGRRARECGRQAGLRERHAQSAGTHSGYVSRLPKEHAPPPACCVRTRIHDSSLRCGRQASFVLVAGTECAMIFSAVDAISCSVSSSRP